MEDNLTAIAKLNVIENPGFSLQRNDKFGRHPVASRDLKCGDLILEEMALSWSPSLDSKPVCLTCTRDVTGAYCCPSCGWPMCNEKCSRSNTHKQNECSIFSSRGLKVDPQSWRSDEAWYSLITILRMLKLRGKKREIANNMEDHLKTWKENENFRCKYSHVVDYALNVLKLDVTEDDILKTITSSYTNDFSFMMPTGNQIHLMFPLTAMMNHSCQPSVYRSIYQTDTATFKMSVRAAKSLREGDQIFNSYIDILDPVTVRQKLLLETKNMTCRCERCQDPTDLGTYGSGVLCRECKGPVIPLDQRTWRCQKCHKTVKSGKIENIIQSIDEEKNEILGNPKKKKIRNIEKTIRKWEEILYPTNLLITRLKYNLIALYGREKGFLTEQLNQSSWRRKKELCEDILESLKVLEPGLTVRKARLMMELHLPLLMLAQIELQQGADKGRIKKDFQKGLITLKLALKVFDTEPEGSWEKSMVRESQTTLREVTDIISSL